MEKKLFLLDSMALIYRAHFAFINRPIINSKGFNTSALFGFTQTLLEILTKQQPTHLAAVFDTAAPTQRHTDFAEYKAHREEMPEELSAALPHLRRLLDAFRIPVVTKDGFEADDLIATLVQRAEKKGFKSYMVSLDKDLGQLVSESIFLFKLPRMGEGGEIMGVPEILKRWNIKRPAQVADVLALMGDASDNIPGVPGIGEKTAIKLITQFDSVENLLAHAGELTGKLRENVEANRDVALMSKKLATLICDAPCDIEIESLKLHPPDEEALKSLLREFEFRSIGRRLFGEDFSIGPRQPTASEAAVVSPSPSSDGGEGRGEEGQFEERPAPQPSPRPTGRGGKTADVTKSDELTLFSETEVSTESPIAPTTFQTLATVAHDYKIVSTTGERKQLVKSLEKSGTFSFFALGTSLDAKEAKLVGLAFSLAPQSGFYIPLTGEAKKVLEEFRTLFESEQIEKVGHDLKQSLALLRWHGVAARGKFFDTMIAHSLVEPELRHTLEYLAESYLGYSPSKVEELPLTPSDGERESKFAIERSDVALRLREKIEPMLRRKGQENVFYEIESPLVPVLVEMEFEGIKLDAKSLEEFAAQLSKEISGHEHEISKLAGTEFNLNSPKQLGQILFDVLKISDAPKRTKTGQYVTDEQTLSELAGDHEIVRRLLEYRTASKLKSTYADALPAAIFPKTGRVHTTYFQVATATGRLNSQNPNLQNIPIRTERGQEIRKAFVPRDKNFLLLSADYSQIELRIIAALSREPGLLEAFASGVDIHAATAAKVFGVALADVNAEMRRKAKMVNFGIAYGISAFGLAQRLGIPRKEGGEIIEEYFKKFPGIKRYMNETIAFARANGYVETVTGRRRYIRDINSANFTVRGSAERNAINAPIQGTAADMIKLAMINIQRELSRRNLKTKMLLQVHDELVFDLHKLEKDEVLPLVEDKMKNAIALDVPIVVEMGVGENWLEAH